jgi:dGTPase
VDAVRAHDRPVVGFSPAVAEPLHQLRSFLHKCMYCHYKVRRMQRTARQVVRELFAVLLEQPDCLPPDWQARAGAPGDARTAEAIADYIAGMTDRFALDEHERLFSLTGSAR